MRGAIPAFAALITIMLTSSIGAAGITVKFEDKSLKDALKVLEGTTGKHFAYAEKFVERANPVSADFKSQPLQTILDQLLRPNGLVEIESKGSTILIAPVSSNSGMAKIAGRALRTMNALEPKLETAKVDGTDLQIPGWTAADDRRVFTAITDLFTAVAYYDDLSVRPSNDDSRRAIELMLNSVDADVRAGAALAFAYWRVGMSSNWQRERNQFKQQEDQRLLELPRRAFADDSPTVRAAWIYTLSDEDMRIPPGTRTDLAKAIEKGSKDKAPIVRAAAAGAVGRDRRLEIDNAILKPLFEDSSAAVRLLAKLAYPRSAHLTVEDFTKHLGDANPIVRTLYLPFVRQYYRGSSEDLINAARGQMEKDPWLARVFDVLFAAGPPRIENRGRGGRGRWNRPTIRRAPFPLDKAFGLVSSDSLALKIAGIGAIAMRFSSDPESIVPTVHSQTKLPADLSTTLTKLANSDNLWAKAFAAFGSAQGFAMRLDAPAKAEMIKRYHESLSSQDAVLNLSALLGAAMLGRDVVSRSLAGETALRLQQTSIDLDYPTAALSSYVLGAGLPMEKALGIFVQRVQAEPKLEPARVTPVLLGLSKRRELWIGRGRMRTGETTPGFRGHIMDIVLNSHDKDIQLAFIRVAHDWLWRSRDGRMMTQQVTQKCEPKVLEFLTTTRPMSFHFNTHDGNERIHKRLRELFNDGDAIQKDRTVKAYATMLSTHEFYMRLRTDEQSQAIRAEARSIITMMVQECFKSVTGRPAGLELLNAVASPQTELTSQWDRIPQPCVDALIKSMKLVTHHKHHGEATSVLNQLLQKAKIRPAAPLRIDWEHEEQLPPGDAVREPAIVNAAWDITKYPKLDAAVTQAKADVLAKGTPVDKITLRVALARAGDVKMAKEVANSIIKKEVPRAELPSAILAAELGPGEESDPFADYLLQTFKESVEVSRVTIAAAQKLRSSVERRPAFTDAFADLVRKGNLDYVHNFVHIAEEDRRRVNAGGQEAPWLPKLSEVGLAVAKNNEATSITRQFGYYLFAIAGGPEAAKKSEEVILDKELPTFIRIAAAERLHQTAPKTDIYKKLTPAVGELPRDLRSRLAVSATRNLDNEGATAFVAGVIDQMVKDQRPDTGLLWQIARQLRNNPDEHIIKALEPLKKDKRLGRMVQGVLRRIQPRDGGKQTTTTKVIPKIKPVQTIKITTPEVRCVARADNGTLLCAKAGGEISVFSADGKEIQGLKGHDGICYSCAITADGKIAVSGGRDNEVRIWDVASGKQLLSCKGHTKTIQDVALSANGKMVASTGLDSTVRIWDVVTGKLLRELKDAKKGCRTVAFSPDGSKVATAGLGRKIYVWRLADGKLLQSLSGHQFSIRDIAFAEDGASIASASDDMTIKIWRLSDGKAVKTLTGHDSLVTSIAFLPGSNRLISASQDGKCLVWKLEGEATKPVKVADGLQGIWSLALSKNGKLTVLGGRSGDVMVFRVP